MQQPGVSEATEAVKEPEEVHGGEGQSTYRVAVVVVCEVAASDTGDKVAVLTRDAARRAASRAVSADLKAHGMSPHFGSDGNIDRTIIAPVPEEIEPVLIQAMEEKIRTLVHQALQPEPVA